MTCLDLRTKKGFRLVNEQTGKRAGKRDDSWELLIPGRSGSVSPYGGDLLIASTRSTVTTKRIIDAVPGAIVNQDADDGQNLLFDVKHFATVAGILKLRKKRVMTAEQREKATERLRGTRFTRKPAA
jgi:hypothetical protein